MQNHAYWKKSVANQDHSFPKFSDHQLYHQTVVMQPRDTGWTKWKLQTCTGHDTQTLLHNCILEMSGMISAGMVWDGHGWSGSIGFLQEPSHAHPKKVLNVNPSLQTSPTSHCHSSIIPETGKINTIMTLRSTTMNTFIMAVIALDGRPLSSVIRLSSV